MIFSPSVAFVRPLIQAEIPDFTQMTEFLKVAALV